MLDEGDGNALGKGERLKGKGRYFPLTFLQCPFPNALCPLPFTLYPLPFTLSPFPFPIKRKIPHLLVVGLAKVNFLAILHLIQLLA